MITLKTLPQATAQEVYDQVKAHLLQQNARSEHNGSCLYRGPGGLKCAAGCLIGDDEYFPEMESSWDDLVYDKSVPDAHEELINRLQEIHDSRDVKNWGKCLSELALEFELNS